MDEKQATNGSITKIAIEQKTEESDKGKTENVASNVCICQSNVSASCPATSHTTTSIQAPVVTVPIPILQNEGIYAYVAVKGSLHDFTCTVFGLNDTEKLALQKRYSYGVKPVVNGLIMPTPPMDMLNTLAQLSYKVVSSCGEAEICWTLQREI